MSGADFFEAQVPSFDAGQGLVVITDPAGAELTLQWSKGIGSLTCRWYFDGTRTQSGTGTCQGTATLAGRPGDGTWTFQDVIRPDPPLSTSQPGLVVFSVGGKRAEFRPAAILACNSPQIWNQHVTTASFVDDVCPDAVVQPDESPAEIRFFHPGPNAKARSNPDGTVTAYDDKNNNNQVDAGEPLATTPIVDPKVRDNPDGSCTLYNDVDHDGIVDAGEALQAFPCPKPKTNANPDGSTTLYEDKDNDNVVDPGEALLTTPASPDRDADLVPDLVEPTLCANENPFFNFDGTCNGTDYHPPTVQGLVDDAQRFLP